MSFEPDLRPAVDKVVPTLREEMAKAQAGAVIGIIVTLQEPVLDTELTPGTTEHDEFRAQHIAFLEHAFAADASLYGFDTKRGLKHSPVVSGSIAVESIEALAGLPMVRAIEFNLQLQLTRIEGGNLIHAFRLQGQGGQGNGIGVAVLDTGIDWTHPELSGQVTAAQDYTGTQTSNPGFDDQGHGTSCAGIIAGNQDGMAPQAHLWAMKVCSRDYSCRDDDVEAALDAAYEHRNEWGGVHVINLSIGGQAPINVVCDNLNPSMTMAMGQLASAGIAILASAGNDGCSNGISFPACISHAISVGAVYDDAIGAGSMWDGSCIPWGCDDLSTEADMITCYSNSGTYLDLLAPSHCASTTALGGAYEPCFGGTSAATPYASGVAAQILSLTSATTPAQLLQALTSTGQPITDPRNGLTRNRIDAVQAYQYLAGGGCTYSISPSSATYGASGGNDSFAVTTQAGCTWNATSNNGWIHITNGASGTGSGNVSYSVDANSGSARSGTVSIAGETFTVTQTAGSGGETYAYQVAGISHAGGAGGSVWRSTLCVTNRSGSTASLTLVYRMAGNSVTRSHVLQNSRIMEWADVAVSLFNQSGSSSGAIEITSDAPVMVVARTYSEAPDGTFGQGMPGNDDSATLESDQMGVLPQLKKTSAFRTNVGLMNHGSAACNVRIKLYSETGSQIGSTIDTPVPAKQWKQINDVFSEAGVGQCPIGYATIEVLTAAGKIWAYGSVVDNGTGDPTTIPLFIQ